MGRQAGAKIQSDPFGLCCVYSWYVWMMNAFASQGRARVCRFLILRIVYICIYARIYLRQQLYSTSICDDFGMFGFILRCCDYSYAHKYIPGMRQVPYMRWRISTDTGCGCATAVTAVTGYRKKKSMWRQHTHWLGRGEGGNVTTYLVCFHIYSKKGEKKCLFVFFHFALLPNPIRLEYVYTCLRTTHTPTYFIHTWGNLLVRAECEGSTPHTAAGCCTIGNRRPYAHLAAPWGKSKIQLNEVTRDVLDGPRRAKYRGLIVLSTSALL